MIIYNAIFVINLKSVLCLGCIIIDRDMIYAWHTYVYTYTWIYALKSCYRFKNKTKIHSVRKFIRENNILYCRRYTLLEYNVCLLFFRSISLFFGFELCHVIDSFMNHKMKIALEFWYWKFQPKIFHFTKKNRKFNKILKILCCEKHITENY